MNLSCFVCRPVVKQLAGALTGICIESADCEFHIVRDSEKTLDDQLIATCTTALMKTENLCSFVFAVSYLDTKTKGPIMDFFKKRPNVSLLEGLPSSSILVPQFSIQSKDKHILLFLLSQ